MVMGQYDKIILNTFYEKLWKYYLTKLINGQWFPFVLLIIRV